MSLKQNLLANYAGQAYAAVIGIVMLPLYVRYMGAEAYGLVGFSVMLQAWFQLVDLGLTPTVTREVSRSKSGGTTVGEVAGMIRSTEWLFGMIGAGGALLFTFFSGWIAEHWLNAQTLGSDELKWCVMFMGGSIATRGLIGLYRGALAGLERMVMLNAAGFLLATLRSVGVLCVMVFWSASPVWFFAYQFGVSLVEWGVMRALFYRQFPMRDQVGELRLTPLRKVLGMAASMTFLAGLWTVISQSDKLILSWTLELTDYGFFIVAVTLASGLTLLMAPLAQVLQPRFTILAAQGTNEKLVELYRTSTQLTTAGAFAIAGVMGLFAEPLLQAWTGSGEIASRGAAVLTLYALGNAVAALLALSFAIQFARGNLRLHVVGNCIFALIWLPGIYWASQHTGAIGVGWVWFGGNFAYLLGWLPWVHRRIQDGLWWRWLTGDVAVVLAAEGAVFLMLAQIDIARHGRWAVLMLCAIGAVIAAVAGLLAGSRTRIVLGRGCRSLLAAKFIRLINKGT